MKISYLVYQFFNLVEVVMLIGVLISWIPNLNREKEPVRSIVIFTDAVFAPFRRFIPPIGMLDISPIFAFIAIGLVQTLICNILVSLGM